MPRSGSEPGASTRDEDRASAASSDTRTPAAADTGDAKTPADQPGEAASGASKHDEVAPLPPELAPRIVVEVKPRTRVTTGDRVTITIAAEVEDGDDVALPDQSFAPFEILGSRRIVHDPRDGKRRFELHVDLVALAPGTHSVGPIELRVVTAKGILGKAHTEALKLEVASLLGNEPNAQLKPPTAPLPVTQEDYTLAWVAGALLALALTVLITLWVARRWRARMKPEAPAAPPRPPHEIALEEIEALRAQLPGMLGRGEGSAWTDAISDTVRAYLGRRFDFDGLESTTDETLEVLGRVPAGALSKVEVAAFLQECDLVKFAKATIGLERGSALLEAAERFVLQTQPPAAREVAHVELNPPASGSMAAS